MISELKEHNMMITNVYARSLNLVLCGKKKKNGCSFCSLLNERRLQRVFLDHALLCISLDFCSAKCCTCDRKQAQKHTLCDFSGCFIRGES